MQMPAAAPARLHLPTRVTRGDAIAIVLSLAPVAMLLAVAADADVTRLVGMSALGFVIGITMAWTALGVAAIARSRSPLARSIAFLVFTIPATIGAVIGPWLAVVALRA